MRKTTEFQPRFSIGPRIAKALMRIEACREAISSLPLSVNMLESLRSSARLVSTHYSTQIEGNRLDAHQVQAVLKGGGPFPGRARDEREVKNYHRALEYLETLNTNQGSVAESMIQTLHGLVESGKKKASRYRDGQNVIRDNRSGMIVYMPPEAKDVPGLMKQCVAWIQSQLSINELPIPVVAALAHYQFATIHPYYDGNGRTARLLTTLILHKGGYGLRGIYSLEEYYAKNLSGYYDALNVGKSHNYYEGREKADCSKFLSYFCIGMANSFENILATAVGLGRSQPNDDSAILRRLDSIQRTALGLFLKQKSVSSVELAQYLQLKPRNASVLANKWVDIGFFELDNPSKRARRYRLTPEFESVVAR
jgi:Fic family protein